MITVNGDPFPWREGLTVSDVMKEKNFKFRLVSVWVNDNVIDWDLEGKDKFIEDLEAKKAAILEFVNSRVSNFSKIRSVEVQKEPFVKTATHKIKRFLYTGERKARTQECNS